MPDHQVKAGDTLVSIAHAHRWRDWTTIWNHENNAALRERRKDPQELVPGDVVHVPAKTPKSLEAAVGQSHLFEVKVLTAHFEAVIRDQAGELLPNKRFRLDIEGRSIDGYTDDHSVISLDIDPAARRGVLKVWMGAPSDQLLTWNLLLGHLEPLETVKGVQARLANLGFYDGPIDGAASDPLKAALRDFQVVHGLALSGEADDATRAKLHEVHDTNPAGPAATTA